ncbi:hypothetical protein NC653_027623 [Populus alba x Populus x berolinensis]|uniref:Peptidase M48 domain-containing protein n=1 Tax=Populus alba x Populus x berolinensis TaxID=444605 RepID=A0AAD6M5V5_9ROSI|nr:hypothetical protein NC653_027623 [Populus alba x Populus x berolinensis]
MMRITQHSSRNYLSNKRLVSNNKKYRWNSILFFFSPPHRTGSHLICELITGILTFLQFGGYTLVRNSTDLFRSFGFDTQPHTVIPLQHLVSFGLNLVSRSFEFQADAFAKKLGYGSALRGGLV